MKIFTNTYDYTRGVISALSYGDLIFSFVWILFVLAALYIYRNTKVQSEYKYFIPFFLFKVVLLLAFVSIYAYYYRGGDSVGFWALSNSLVELSFSNFSSFINEMFGGYDPQTSMNEFRAYGIRYPGWILRESEGYFVAKVTWFFSLISGKNFLLASLYFMLFSFLAQWRLFLLIKQNFISSSNSKLHLLFLFIPSVSFWCTGIGKDTLIFIGIVNIVYYMIKWFVLKERKIKYILWIVFYSWIIIQTREIVFVVVIISFLITWLLTLVNDIENKALKTVLRFASIFIGLLFVIVGFYFFGLQDFIDPYLDEANMIQGDFSSNDFYTGKKYSLGVSNLNLVTMVLVSPIAIFTGIFRPAIWESFSLTLLINGIESTIYIYLFLKLILFRWGKFYTAIFNNWILMFSFIFVILFALITGLTSVIFGVLVRLRAPLLIFFALLLYWEEVKPNLLKSKD